MNPKYGYALHCVACDAPLAAAIEEKLSIALCAIHFKILDLIFKE